jgi:deoxyribose-phosphate aldolase
MTGLELCQAIDQTNLDPMATIEAYQAFCEEAARYRFASVSILPLYVETAAAVLKGTDTKVDAAISYPLSAVPGSLKAAEAADAVRRGADEIDYLMDVGALKTGEYGLLVDEARQVVAAADGRVVKAIIEMWGLSEVEVRAACEIACEAGVTFVKSSTGYKGHKALRLSTLGDARLLLRLVGDRAKVKIAGGIRDTDFALDLLDLGVARVGTSSGVAIVEGFKQRASSR